MIISILDPNCSSKLYGYENDKECSQPNAVDMRVEKILKIVHNQGFSKFKITENNNITHLMKKEVELVDNCYNLVSGNAYEIVFKGTVEIGPNECGSFKIRSSLNRNGLWIESGLYDSGYKGALCCTLHTYTDACIERGARLCQFVLMTTKSLSTYNGHYGSESEYDKLWYTKGSKSS